MGTGTKEDESSTGHVWAAGFHHVTSHSLLAHVLRLTKPLITLIFPSFSGCSKLRVTETTDTESVETEAQLHCSFSDDQCQIQKLLVSKKKPNCSFIFIRVLFKAFHSKRS
jgi:hypothetical protein